MKKIFIISVSILIFLGIIFSENQIDVKEIIQKCAKAMGGMEKIKNLKTLSIKFNMSDHGPAMTTDLERPRKARNLSRGGTSLMINNSEEACFLRKSKGSKTFDKLIAVKKEEMPDFVAEPGFFFPYIFDHSAKFIKIVKINDKKAYLLKIKMPHQVTMDYYIDCQTFLPVKTAAHVFNNGKWSEWIRTSADFKMVEGINYPHSFTYSWKGVKNKYEGKVEKVIMNPKFSPDYFKIPKKLN